MSTHAKRIRRAVNEFEKKHKIARGKSLVLAGAALHLHGLRPDINDVDIVHPDLTAYTKGMYANLEVDAGPGDHISERSLQSEKLHGVQVPTLDALLDFYQNNPRMNRPKDQVWIELLKKKMQSK